MFSRRQFGLLTGGFLTSGLLMPRRTLARPSSIGDRKFVFIFNDGGWDTGFGDFVHPQPHVHGLGCGMDVRVLHHAK